MKSRIILAVLVLTSTSILASASDMAQGIAQMEAQGSAPQAALPDDLSNKHERALADLKSVGYINDPNGVSRSEYIMEKMASRLAEVNAMGSASEVASLGFEKLVGPNDFAAERKLSALPNSAIYHDSENYLFPSGSRNKRLFTKTDFGILLVDEGFGAMNLDQPNLVLSGFDAKVVHSKHGRGSWSTTIYAGNSEKVFIIESNANLRGATLEKFVSFAEELVLSP